MRRDGLHAAARRLGMAGLVAAGLLTLPGDRAEAATACGTLITNVATATMTSGFPDFVAYAVSYNATCAVVVLCPPTVRLMKWATTPQCAAGCTVTFQVCIENGSLDTVWAVMITDALPGNTTFAVMNTAASYDMTMGGPWVLGAVTTFNGPTWTCGVAGAPNVGQAPVWYMRWVVPGIGPSKSACVSYGARIL